MVDAAKAFLKEPPLEPLHSLDAIVRDFQWRYVDRKKTDQVIEWCRVAPDFPTAVQRAVESRGEDGKHHNHQSKVDLHARRRFGRRIIRAGSAGRLPMDDFDDLHDHLDDIKPYGIGPVTVYDVAVRVGAYLVIEPKSVYLHAGVRKGFDALVTSLMNSGSPKFANQLNMMRVEGKVPVRMFPPPLRTMRADDVEDILCTYRGVLETW